MASQKKIDIFCLQEVYHNARTKMATDEREYCFNIFSEIHDRLPTFNANLEPVIGIGYGIGMFVKKEEKFADYVLTCPKVTVNNFSVLNYEISDHSPLVLDFT